MSEIKNEIVRRASAEVVEYVKLTHGIDVDDIAIMEIINLNIRDFINAMFDF